MQQNGPGQPPSDGPRNYPPPYPEGSGYVGGDQRDAWYDAHTPPMSPGQTGPAAPDPHTAPPGAYRRPAPAWWRTYRISQIAYLILGILEGLLLLRFCLKLLAADPNAPFSQFIYSITQPFVAPFQGVFPEPSGSSGAVLDLATLLAMLIYALLVWGILRIVTVVRERPPGASA